jgi:hypothetical protein
VIPDTWQEVALNTSPQFVEEIGFFGTVPCGHPISLLASVKNALRERVRRKLEKLKIPRQRFCILYYARHDPRACDGKIDMEVEWWGPCQDVFSIIQSVYGWCLGADDADATHALVHDRRLNRWYLAPIREAERFVYESNEDLK